MADMEIPSSVKSCWLVMGPGMPLKVVLVETTAREQEVKDAYRRSIHVRRTELDMDPDIQYPTCKMVPKEEVIAKYSHLLQFTLVGDIQPRLVWIRAAKPETKK